MNSAQLRTLAASQGITLDPCLLVDYPLGTWFWFVRYYLLAEQLTEPLTNWIAHILTEALESERKVRLAALRPVKNQAACASVQKVCNKACASALKTHIKAYDEARKAYKKADISARKARNKTCIPAWKAYNEACAPAWTICNEACASTLKVYEAICASGQQACNEALSAQYASEYPDHPAFDAKTGLVFHVLAS